MKTKSIRIPISLERAVHFVERRENIEEPTAMRKLVRVGFESYIAMLYQEGALSLRSAARLLELSLSETNDRFNELGARGNLTAGDVLQSLESLGKTVGSRLR